MESERRIETAKMLVYRLERLSADSWWAHRASGLRGSLLRTLDRLSEQESVGASPHEWAHLETLVKQGFLILEGAARELREGDVSPVDNWHP